MAILHKNISAEGDIHNPKWFSGANNGDVAWRNELGVLESTDELVLPAALDFVDGSVAPPTSNNGDIYVLSSGASVNAGWGTVSLGDWVRYDGTTWNVITPQKSSLCYNETTDALNSYDGSTWAAIGSGGGGGGNTIYTANDTIGTGRVATLTDTLTFKDGTVNIQGAGTSTGSALAIYNNDTTPVKLWDFLDNGNLNGNKSKTTLIAQNNTQNDSTQFVFSLKRIGGQDLMTVANDGYFQLGDSNSITGGADYSECFQVGKGNSITSNGSNKVNIGIGNSISGNNKSDQFIFGKSNTCNGNDQVLIGQSISGSSGSGVSAVGNIISLAGSYSCALASYSNNLSSYSGVLGVALESTANGAFVIGYGDSTNFNNKLVNNTGDSLALGWNTTTPQHLFKSNGVNLTLPTSATGLSSGDLWNDGGTVKIV